MPGTPARDSWQKTQLDHTADRKTPDVERLQKPGAERSPGFLKPADKIHQ